MVTIANLKSTLGDALGLPHRAVDETVRALRAANMLPIGSVQATIEHAVVLLLALMAAPDPKAAPDCARLYAQLPLDCVTRTEPMPDGRTEMLTVADTAPLMADVRDLGESFGTFLASALRLFSGPPDATLEPGEIVVGGGLGTASAGVMLSVWNGSNSFVGYVKFSLTPMGAGCLPDDAAVARLDLHASVPGSIFTVLSGFLMEDQDSPRGPLHRAPM